MLTLVMSNEQAHESVLLEQGIIDHVEPKFCEHHHKACIQKENIEIYVKQA